MAHESPLREVVVVFEADMPPHEVLSRCLRMYDSGPIEAISVEGGDGSDGVPDAASVGVDRVHRWEVYLRRRDGRRFRPADLNRIAQGARVAFRAPGAMVLPSGRG